MDASGQRLMAFYKWERFQMISSSALSLWWLWVYWPALPPWLDGSAQYALGLRLLLTSTLQPQPPLNFWSRCIISPVVFPTLNTDTNLDSHYSGEPTPAKTAKPRTHGHSIACCVSWLSNKSYSLALGKAMSVAMCFTQLCSWRQKCKSQKIVPLGHR